jgi:hypothetical protein
MRPVTIVGSTASSSCSHSRKRRPTSWSGASKAAVRAHSSRYASTSCACVRSTSARVEASALSTRLRRLPSRASSSSARWRARLASARASLASACAACASAMALFASLLSSTNCHRRFPLLGLRSGQPLCQLAAFAFRSRLLPDSIRMLRPKTLDFGSKLRSQSTRRDMVGEVGRLPQKNHETRNHIKAMNYRSPTRLTCFSCCDTCLSCWDTEPATSLAVAADEISPFALKVDHGSCEAPFTPPTAVGEVAATDVGTTANRPASDPAP